MDESIMSVPFLRLDAPVRCSNCGQESADVYAVNEDAALRGQGVCPRCAAMAGRPPEPVEPAEDEETAEAAGEAEPAEAAPEGETTAEAVEGSEAETAAEGNADIAEGDSASEEEPAGE